MAKNNMTREVESEDIRVLYFIEGYLNILVYTPNLRS
jgi:hypothetical protein